jgi:ribosomal peptide maturation radical SAM protein 1
MDIMLVNMPYASLARPSLALGLLQAVLSKAGFSARSLYANLFFLDNYDFTFQILVNRCLPDDGLGEWTFSRAAFPEHRPDDDHYFKRLIKRNPYIHQVGAEQAKAMALETRRRAGKFVDRLAGEILAERPSIVGCTSTFQQQVPSLALLRRLRELDPGVVTMLGGANCETVMGRQAHQSFPWVDYVVSGEADGLIAGLVGDILEHGGQVPLEKIPLGVFTPLHREQGYPALAQAQDCQAYRASNHDLGSLPTPDYDDYFATLERVPRIRDMTQPGLLLETSRGCWWGQKDACTFCGLNGHGDGYRVKPAQRALQNMEELHQRYGLDRMNLADNILPMSYFKSLLPALAEKGAPYRIFYEIKSNLRRRHLEGLRQAGVIWIQPGIESLDSRVLQLMNKGCKAYHNIQTIKWCRQYGVRCSWNILTEFPGEEDQWYQEMAGIMPLLTHLQPPTALIKIRYHRFSRYVDHASDYGLRLEPSELYPIIYPLPAEQIRDLVYYFEDPSRLREEDNPWLAALLQRPGLDAVRDEMALWNQGFWAAGAPMLSMHDHMERLLISDTRALATAPSHVLQGAARAVYLACDAARRPQRLTEEMALLGFSAAQVDQAVERLLADKLMLALDGRLLALALEEPVPPLPKSADNPAGFVDSPLLGYPDTAEAA